MKPLFSLGENSERSDSTRNYPHVGPMGTVVCAEWCTFLLTLVGSMRLVVTHPWENSTHSAQHAHTPRENRTHSAQHASSLMENGTHSAQTVSNPWENGTHSAQTVYTLGRTVHTLRRRTYTP